jgi:hypothetical protein
MLISSIIAKALAFVDALLGVWVTVVNTVPQTTNCYDWDVLNVAMTPCGNEFVADVASIAAGLSALLPGILAGLFAI